MTFSTAFQFRKCVICESLFLKKGKRIVCSLNCLYRRAEQTRRNPEAHRIQKRDRMRQIRAADS